MRGLKSLVSNNEASLYTEEIFNDFELAHRKAEEAAARRYQAAEWLRRMDHGATETLPKEPSEEEFRLALRNGLILCNVLNKVNPGAVLKVVENPILAVQATEGAAQSAIQYFENMRNFLVAVKDMQLLTFEASDMEKGGSSNKVVDCILCLKGYYEWKQAGGIGVWRYGGTVKITSFPTRSSSLVGSESADDSFDESESSQYEQLLEFLHLSNEISIEESKTANALAFLFDRFGLRLLQAYLRESNGIEEFPLNAMVIDTLLSKVVKDFSAMLVSQGTQLGLFLKKVLKGEVGSLSKADFMEAISQYLGRKASLVPGDFSKDCICGGKREIIQHVISPSPDHTDLIDRLQKQLQELKLRYQETKGEVRQIQLNWEEELGRLEHYIKNLEVAASSYQKVLEENRVLYNQVQDLKGTIRVYCRVRPFLPGQSNGQSTIDYIGENGNIMVANPFKQGKDSRKMFLFNKVFGPKVSQEQIYIDTQPLIRSVLDGFNVCIFAYGQTGSGKTYTMSGPDLTTEETWGVNYRALRDLFQLSKTKVDFINVLTVHVLGKELVTGSILKGCLHLVDLAGSERVDKSEAVGERLKEAQHINRSLSALGDVISALAQKSTHIPYRNSKLTQVLQDSLGGQAKTLMFVHVNPETNAVGETISTLKFAERVSSIELGAARSNKESGEIRELKEEISNLKQTLERKEAEMEQLKGGSTRIVTEPQKPRAVSPFHLPRYGIGGASLKSETNQRSNDDSRSLEARSCSSGKQRRSRFPSALADKEAFPKMPLLVEDGLGGSTKPRTSSPSVRRSISTDRGAVIRSRVKPDTIENQPISKLPFPARVPVNKSIAAMPTTITSSTDHNNNSRLYMGSQEPAKQDNIIDSLSSLQKVSTRRVYLEHEDDQFRQALNIRQGGIRKSKPENKAKAKHQLPARLQKSDMGIALLSDMDAGEKMEEARKSDFSEPENELLVSPVPASLKAKKVRQNFSRNSQNLEPRYALHFHLLVNIGIYMCSLSNKYGMRNLFRGLVQPVEPFLAAKVENKLSNGMANQAKEGGNPSMPEFRRSRSTPRGKFFNLP
ncbi:hypothetical protein LWI29_037644 [Acer saccharum]|uniref:Uncharacterized protein n=1 Tax=Acer saccharum TaxID=4024 RepID=A0AA39TAJ0_ACESA|nr:hypothetical protein LWI29_037644 [Acer saccharum]